MTSLSRSTATQARPRANRPQLGRISQAHAQAQAAYAAEVTDFGESPQIAPPIEAPAHAIDCTLIEVMEAIAEVSDSDEEVLATLAHMLESGRIKLSELPGPQATQTVVYC